MGITPHVDYILLVFSLVYKGEGPVYHWGMRECISNEHHHAVIHRDEQHRLTPHGTQ